MIEKEMTKIATEAMNQKRLVQKEIIIMLRQDLQWDDIGHEIIRYWMDEIKIEYYSARKAFGPFNTMHEGWAIIKEEFDELWDEIKKKKPNNVRIKEEAVQVGAMVLSFLNELVNVDLGEIDI